MTNPKFISRKAYEARREYIKQWQAYHRDPDRNPEPDHSLRLVDATHGPITGVRLTRDPRDGAPITAVSYGGRNERLFDPLDEVALELGIGHGGGVNIHPNGTGMAYPRIRVSQPEGRAIWVPRILVGAGPWQVANQRAQDGSRHEYHHLRRMDLSKGTVQAVWEEGKASRVPRLGREAFLEAVAYYWSRNHLKANIGGSLEELLGLIQTALTIGDERHAAYLRDLRDAA